MKKKAPSIEEFLRARKVDQSWRGGMKCQTCAHPEVKAINGELRIFAQAKKDGHEMPWTRFIRDRLREVYGVRVCLTAIMRHVHECLRIP